jgi:hypothetical protein
MPTCVDTTGWSSDLLCSYVQVQLMPTVLTRPGADQTHYVDTSGCSKDIYVLQTSLGAAQAPIDNIFPGADCLL